MWLPRHVQDDIVDSAGEVVNSKSIFRPTTNTGFGGIQHKMREGYKLGSS